MKKIHTVNTTLLPFSAKQIWEIIGDVESYSLWWPAALKTEILNRTDNIVGSKIAIRPYGGLPFFCEFSDAFAYVRLVMRYSGLYCGSGVWTLTETDGQTEVEYAIDLEIDNLFIRLLSYFVPIDSIHHRLMNDVLLGLENRLKDTAGSGS